MRTFLNFRDGRIISFFARINIKALKDLKIAILLQFQRRTTKVISYYLFPSVLSLLESNSAIFLNTIDSYDQARAALSITCTTDDPVDRALTISKFSFQSEVQLSSILESN